jgi:hypothetical protein
MQKLLLRHASPRHRDRARGKQREPFVRREDDHLAVAGHDRRDRVREERRERARDDVDDDQIPADVILRVVPYERLSGWS